KCDWLRQLESLNRPFVNLYPSNESCDANSRFSGPNSSTYLLDVIGCFNLNRPINQSTTSNTQMNGAMRNNDLLVGILPHIYSMSLVVSTRITKSTHRQPPPLNWMVLFVRP